MSDWKTRFEAWQAYAEQVNAQARRIKAMQDARAWAMVRPYGMKDMCCVHNASISEVGVGWGAGPDGKAKIKAARRAARILDDWRASRLADALIRRHFPR